MEQPPAVAFTAFADAWPRAIETEIGAADFFVPLLQTIFRDLRADPPKPTLFNTTGSNGSNISPGIRLARAFIVLTVVLNSDSICIVRRHHSNLHISQ